MTGATSVGALDGAMISGGVPDPYLVYDTFTDANATNLNAHTPDKNKTGNVYVIEAGDVEVNTNHAIGNAVGFNQASVETGISDVTLEADFTRKTDAVATNAQWGFILRWKDGNNYLLVRHILNLTEEIQLLENKSAWTMLDNAAYSWADEAIHTIKVIASGTSIKVYIDDVEKLSATEADFETETEHGLVFYNANSDYADNFSIKG